MDVTFVELKYQIQNERSSFTPKNQEGQPKKNVWSSNFDGVQNYSDAWNSYGRGVWTSTKDYSLTIFSH